MKGPLPLIGFVLVAAVLVFARSCGTDSPPRGRLGAYRLPDGRVISIRASEGASLRYRSFDTGLTRRLYPRDDHYVTGAGYSIESPIEMQAWFETDVDGLATSVRMEWADGVVERADRVPARTTSVAFGSGEATLCGRLDLPEGPGPFPAMVPVHGSGSDAAQDFMYTPDFYLASGFAVLTYDKRGTGCSGGDFTFDYDALARDAVAATRWLAARPEVDGDRIVMAGYSQGGWVAPLAAGLGAPVRGVIVNYGMIESSAEEARLETRRLMEDRGLSESELDAVDELTLGAVRIVASRFADGWDDFYAARARYEGEPWVEQLSGTTVGRLLALPRWVSQLIGPWLDLDGLDWYYSSDTLLDTLSTPTVWLLGDADRSAPNELTIPKLRSLSERRPLELVVFGGADHGALVFTEEDGVRIYTGHHPDWFRTEVEKARELTGVGADPNASPPAGGSRRP